MNSSKMLMKTIENRNRKNKKKKKKILTKNRKTHPSLANTTRSIKRDSNALINYIMF